MAAADARGEPVDLALLDLTMPRLNGLAVMAALRDSHPDLPVILTSGYDQDQVTADGPQPDGFLPKPCSRRDVEQVIGAALDRARS